MQAWRWTDSFPVYPLPPPSITVKSLSKFPGTKLVLEPCLEMGEPSTCGKAFSWNRQEVADPLFLIQSGRSPCSWLGLVSCSLEKTLMLGGIADRRRRGRQRMRWLDGHHWLDGRESEWTPGVGDGQGGLVCCNSWGREELDTTERPNWTELIISIWIVSSFRHSE